MGIIQKDALRTMLISYLGLILGYLNKGVLFIVFLRTEQIGIISLILSIGYLFAQFTNLGSLYSIWKFFPYFKNKETNNYGFLAFNFLIVSIGVAFFTLVYVFFKNQIGDYYSVNSPEFIRYYYLVLPVGIFMGYYFLFDNYLRSLYKNTFSVFLNSIVLRLVTTISIVLYIYEFLPFDSMVYLICFSYMLLPVLLYISLSRMGEGRIVFKEIRIRSKMKKLIFKYSLYSYVNSMGTIVVVTMDTVMIASILGLKSTGVYTTIIYLTSMLQVPYRSLIRVSNPIITEYWKEKAMDKMSFLYKQMSSVTLVLALFFFLLIWINRNELFGLLPSDFHDGMDVFFFLMVGRLIDMYLGLNGTIFVTSSKYRYDVLFTISLIVIVFVLNLVLIPKYGIIGAAISTSIAFIIYNVGRLLFVWIAFKLNPFRWSQLKVILYFSGITLFFELIDFNFINVYFTICLNWIVYGLMVIFGFLVLKIEPEITIYIDKVTSTLLKKLSKK